MFGSGNDIIAFVVPLLVVLLIGFAFLEGVIYDREKWVRRCLTLAERDFNNLVNGGSAHGGRLERVAERREWNEMVNPPMVQINTEGFRSIAHDLIDANEKEMGSKGATMGKAAITAFLLRQLYEGDVKGAQIKIFADTRNNGAPPYIAPGIYELVGFDKFDKEKGFPSDAGVEKWLLKRVVRRWDFPRDIRLIKTNEAGEKTFHEPFEALAQFTQQNLS